MSILCPQGRAVAQWQITRRAMSSTGRSSQMKPHLPWVTLTSTAVVIPMPASTAIRGGAKRPDSGRGWVLEDLAAGPARRRRRYLSGRI